jgi:hypothetical protein
MDANMRPHKSLVVLNPDANMRPNDGIGGKEWHRAMNANFHQYPLFNAPFGRIFASGSIIMRDP